MMIRFETFDTSNKPMPVYVNPAFVVTLNEGVNYTKGQVISETTVLSMSHVAGATLRVVGGVGDVMRQLSGAAL